MCMGCGSTFLQSSDGKAPDAVDTTFWLVGLMLWILWLNHMKAYLFPATEKHKKSR